MLPQVNYISYCGKCQHYENVLIQKRNWCFQKFSQQAKNHFLQKSCLHFWYFFKMMLSVSVPETSGNLQRISLECGDVSLKRGVRKLKILHFQLLMLLGTLLQGSRQAFKVQVKLGLQRCEAFCLGTKEPGRPTVLNLTEPSIRA